MFMGRLVLLVNTDAVVLKRIESLLSKEGYVVAAAEGFPRAKELLSSFSPDLLVTDVRLGAFNGLHLAFRARLDYSTLPVIITDERYDSVLEQEATRLGAAYLVNPLENDAFLSNVRAALNPKARLPPPQSPVTRRPIGRATPHEAPSPSTPRLWARKQVSYVVEARAVSTRARVVDVSYGGLRLAFDNQPPEVPTAFDITLPAAGLTVTARRIWMYPGREGKPCWCGVEVAGTEKSGSSQWRAFVDSVQSAPSAPTSSFN